MNHFHHRKYWTRRRVQPHQSTCLSNSCDERQDYGIKGGGYDTKPVTKLLHSEGLQPGPQISKSRKWAEI